MERQLSGTSSKSVYNMWLWKLKPSLIVDVNVRVMLLFFIHLTLVGFGSPSSLTEELCYGSKYSLPSQFSPSVYTLTITYTPKVGDPKTVVNNGLSLDQRFQVSQDVIEMADLTEQDNEAVLSTEAPIISVKLIIKNCGIIVRKLYGSSVIWNIPGGAEYLEFSKFTGSNVPARPTILWNRTDSSFTRGNLSSSDYEIKDLTQQDSGYYKFRGSHNQLLTWAQITVEEHVQNHTFDRGNYIVIEFPVGIIPSQVRFTQKGADTYTVLESNERVDITDRYLSIDDSTYDDAGRYDFVDNKGNLILRVVIGIKEEDDPPAHWFLYLAVSVFFVAFAVLGGKLCWNKYKNKKRAATEPEAVPPAVNYLRVTKSNTVSDPTSV